ncbi:MAG: hypothetical protein CMJ64_05705 [Planctomycetaceae bacterium]|nr:hypothetical protein [Planctomycetaceae bacterium]
MCCLVGPIDARAADSDTDRVRFFESKVRPLFVEHCYECHGPKKQESDLRLDTVDGILEGGASGPAVVPNEPEESLILVALSYRDDDLQMPPDGKLPDQTIAEIRRWIEEGAVMPDGGSPKPRRGKIDLEKARQFWAFQPPVASGLPEVSEPAWASSPIDYFILAQLEAKGIAPARRADKRTLIRRVTFDLIGLPPTPEEIDAFLRDESPDAFATVVDRLLNSVRYGERWARHWLDVARYADSNGLDENIAHGNAWRYRDYVIAAMNQDKPFDQFVIEQIAGDLLPGDGEQARHERLIATGFLSLGPKVLAEGDQAKLQMDIIDEQIDTLGRAIVGLTFGCARCHDHKFDPVSMDDYYRLAGIFKSTKTMESFKRIARWNENSIATAADIKRKETVDTHVAEHKAAIKVLADKANAQLKAGLAEGEKLPKDAESKFPQEVQTELKQLREALAELEKELPGLTPTSMGVVDDKPQNVQVHLRGSHLSLGKQVDRGVVEVLAFDGQPVIGDKTSGRLELAHWLVRPEQPLTSRVIVNRVWRWHFGRGLVESTDNFGELGDRPINQPLLDWLANRLVQAGWSLKELHRTIVLSSTYQMPAVDNPIAATLDPENRLHWRANIRRLEAEAIRDSLLAVAGSFDSSMGGSMLHVANRAFLFDHTSKDETSYDTRRRSIYLPVIRNNLADFFSLFDYSDASVPNGNRATSTIAPQALFMMNSDLLVDCSVELANRLVSASPDRTTRIRRLYELAYGREPIEAELEQAGVFLEAVRGKMRGEKIEEDGVESRCLEALCHVVLASSEFLYVR